MRSEDERDEQTLDIVGTLLTAGLLWFFPVAVLAFVSEVTGGDGVPGIVLVAAGTCFVATVIGTLRRLR